MSLDKTKMNELLNSYPGLQQDEETLMVDDSTLSKRGSGASSSSSDSHRDFSSSTSDLNRGGSSSSSDANRGSESSSSNSNNASASNNAKASNNGSGKDNNDSGKGAGTGGDNSAKLRVAEVSSWIGAGRIALEELGLTYVFSTETDPAAIKVQEFNFDKKPSNAIPVHHAKIPDFDILLGSISRLRPAAKSKKESGKEAAKVHFDRNRDVNFKNIMKLLKLKKPAMFLIEKIEQSYKSINEKDFEILESAFQEASYSFKTENLNAYNFGSPQDKSRWYLVGIRKDLDPKETLEKYFQFPASYGAQNSTILDIIEENILPPSEDTAYYPADLSKMIPFVLQQSKEKIQQIIHDFKENPNPKTLEKFQKLMQKVYKVPASNFTKKPLDKNGLNVNWTESGRLKPYRGNKSKHDIYSGDPLTNYARASNRGHVDNIIELGRRLSLREEARVQTFPDSFKFPESLYSRKIQYMISNSFTVNVIRAIGEAMVNYYAKLQTKMAFDEQPLAKQHLQGFKYYNSNALVNLGTLFDTIDLLEEIAKKRKEGEQQGEGLGKIPKEQIRKIRAGYIKLMEEYELKQGKVKREFGRKKVVKRTRYNDDLESDICDLSDSMDEEPDTIKVETRQAKRRKIEYRKIDVTQKTVHFMFDRNKVATYHNGSLVASAESAEGPQNLVGASRRPSNEMHGFQGLLALSGSQLSSGSSSAQAPAESSGLQRLSGLAPKLRTSIPGVPRSSGGMLSDLHVQRHPRLSDLRRQPRLSDVQQQSSHSGQSGQSQVPQQQSSHSGQSSQLQVPQQQQSRLAGSEVNNNLAARAQNLAQAYPAQPALQPIPLPQGMNSLGSRFFILPSAAYSASLNMNVVAIQNPIAYPVALPAYLYPPAMLFSAQAAQNAAQVQATDFGRTPTPGLGRASTPDLGQSSVPGYGQIPGQQLSAQIFTQNAVQFPAQALGQNQSQPQPLEQNGSQIPLQEPVLTPEGISDQTAAQAGTSSNSYGAAAPEDMDLSGGLFSAKITKRSI